MSVDLKHSLAEGMNYLKTWRNRYSKYEYPEKLVLNIFYRKHTMNFMFPEILNCFENDFLDNPKIKWNDFNFGYIKLKELYGRTAIEKTQPILLNLIADKKRYVGMTNFNDFTNPILEAQNGNQSKLEELEYAYLYYLLTDDAILLWAGIGGTGISKMETFEKMTNVRIKDAKITKYEHIDELLGKYAVAVYLNKNYNPL